MNQTNYEHIILSGIRHLTHERLREVADFVYFLRHRDEDGIKYQRLIETDLADFEKSELEHLELEFADYDQLYPHQ